MDFEQRLTLLEAMVKRLNESATVGGYTQARHERYMDEHAAWLQSHDQALITAAEQAAEFAEQDRKLAQRIDSLVTDNKALGERIESLVSSIGKLISLAPPAKESL